jgi:[amino group carrier protein]-lysine/ornithine hydrolase
VTDDEAVDFLVRLIGIESHTGNEAGAVELLTQTLSGAGLATEVDGAGNAIGRAGAGSGRRLMFLGHIDTAAGDVPVRVEDDCVFGRGAVDAKGPLAAAAVAAIRSRENGGPSGTIIEIIGAVGEEGPSHGARHLLRGSSPDGLIIGEPGGSDSIVLGYKGSMRASFAFSLPSGHTAGPNPTVCDTAFDAWRRVKDVCASFSSGDGSFDSLTPALLDFESCTDGLTQTATLKASFRLPPNLCLHEARMQLGCAVHPGTANFEHADPAFRAPKDTPLVASFLRAVRSEDLRPRFKVKTGTSDMNVVAPVWGCPTVAYGPGDSTLDHTPNEHIPIEEFLRGVRVLTRVFQEFQ